MTTAAPAIDILVPIRHEDFNRVGHVRTRLVLAQTAERRELFDRDGNLIAFSQRLSDRGGGQTINYYLVRRERVEEVLP